MKDELHPLAMDPSTSARLPLGLRRILVSDAILDDATARRSNLDQPKYRHVANGANPPGKPISKVTP